jgi:hypothetical protein
VIAHLASHHSIITTFPRASLLKQSGRCTQPRSVAVETKRIDSFHLSFPSLLPPTNPFKYTMSGKKPAAGGGGDKGRLWASDSEDSASKSGSESGSESSDEQQAKGNKVAARAAAAPQMRFRGGNESESESEDDVKRVVRTAKDRKWEALTAATSSIRNAIRINDWSAIEAGA